MLLDYRKILSSTILMASKHFFLKSTPLPPAAQLLTSRNCSKIIFSAFPSKPISNLSPFSLKTSGFSFTPHANTSSTVELENPEVETHNSGKLLILNEKLKQLGIDCGHCNPGQYNGLSCPMCKGSGEKTLSLLITKEGDAALWTCFRAKCGWRGNTRAFASVESSYGRMNGKITKVNEIRQITEQELKLQPLCSEIREYFAERMISAETLRRNFVMQRTYGDQFVMAFTYRRNGELVSCKYRDINKKFWQEKDTEKIFYGLDDINGASDIIIVEGEIDKLSMEEAGFRNCVSVPDGSPPSVTKKKLPSEEEDTKYQYLWNCKEYLEKASRIILATDGDRPGQALAEELARRLGRERCWRVKWPKKNGSDHFKDANEVLTNLGAGALRDIINSAELYQRRI